MNRDEIREKLIEYIKEKLQAEEITETTQLESFDEFSSIFVVELILFIEETFNIEISYEDYSMENYSDVANIVDLVIRNSDSK
jgi:acyl carrier protein